MDTCGCPISTRVTQRRLRKKKWPAGSSRLKKWREATGLGSCKRLIYTRILYMKGEKTADHRHRDFIISSGKLRWMPTTTAFITKVHTHRDRRRRSASRFFVRCFAQRVTKIISVLLLHAGPVTTHRTCSQNNRILFLSGRHIVRGLYLLRYYYIHALFMCACEHVTVFWDVSGTTSRK